MNRTLFDCGLKKSVELKDGTLYDITPTLKKTVEPGEPVLCSICHQSFTGKQYFDIHMQFKHKNSTATDNPSSSNKDSVQTDLKQNLPRIVIDVESKSQCDGPTNQQNKPKSHEKRRGSAKRKSYSVEFKKQTLDLLDSLKTSTNKFTTVAREKGVSKSQVVKWNKDRKKF